ncbi:TPA: hypothetical protein ACNFPT_004181 [Enterobacter ludwigii]
MSNIDNQALREELSNPAIGSNALLRKLALSLLGDLEVATDACNSWQRKFAEADERLVAAEKRIAELEEREAEPVAWTDEHELRDVAKHGCGYLYTVNPITPHADPRRVIKLYTAPPALSETVEVARAALNYIDALPVDIAAALPAMPGFDHDWAENVLSEAVPKEAGKCT